MAQSPILIIKAPIVYKGSGFFRCLEVVVWLDSSSAVKGLGFRVLGTW